MSEVPSPAIASAPPIAGGKSARGRFAGQWLMVCLLALLVYSLTANRGAQWQDSGGFIIRVMQRDPIGTLGLALSHPLHHWLGRLVVRPGRMEPSFAITLISAVGAAVAVANVFGCVRSLTGRSSASLFAAVSLAVANTFWHLATITEVYTLSAALLAGECWYLVLFARNACRRALIGMFLLNGLDFANHLQAVLTLPVIGIVALVAMRQGKVSARYVAIACAAWCLGSLPYTGLVAAEMVHTGDVAGTIRSALFGKIFADEVLGVFIPLSRLAISLAFVAFNFPNLFLPAAALGIFRAKQAGVPAMTRRALLAVLVVHTLFVVRYNVIDQHTFFMPTYILLAIFAGVGTDQVLRVVPVRRARIVAGAALALLALTPVMYAVAPCVARRFSVLERFDRHRPYRDEYTYILVPWSVVETSAERMGAEAVRLAEPDGIIFYEDPMGGFAVEYKGMTSGLARLEVAPAPSSSDVQGLEGFERRVREAVASGRPVVLVPDHVEKIRTLVPPGMAWVRQGDLYVLRAAPASRPGTAPDSGVSTEIGGAP